MRESRNSTENRLALAEDCDFQVGTSKLGRDVSSMEDRQLKVASLLGTDNKHLRYFATLVHTGNSYCYALSECV